MSFREIWKSIRIFIAFILCANAFMTVVWYQVQYRKILQVKIYAKEYKKVKVLVDSIVTYSGGSGSGKNYFLEAHYKKPKGWVKVRYDYNEYPNSKYQKLEAYKKAHNDSINVWYHPKYYNHYAEEKEISVTEILNKNGVIILSILFYVGVLTIIYIVYILVKKKLITQRFFDKK